MKLPGMSEVAQAPVWCHCGVTPVFPPFGELGGIAGTPKHRSTAGSPRASAYPTWRRPKPCSTNCH